MWKIFKSPDTRADETLSEIKTKLEEAVTAPDALRVKELLAQTVYGSGGKTYNINPDVRPTNSTSLLHLAAIRGHTDIAKILIEAGATVDKCDTNDMLTPLHSTARYNAPAIAKILIDHGANINAQSTEGLTPLHRAVFYNKTSMVKFLIEAGADTSICDNKGHSPLRYATERNLPHFVALLGNGELPPSPEKNLPNFIAMLDGKQIPALADTPNPAPETNSEWEKVDDQTIARKRVVKSTNMTLVEIFDFAARERITSTKFDGFASAPERLSFDRISDKAPLEEACHKLIEQGGKADAATIHAPPRRKENLLKDKP